jgi:regulator of protease activity HflC (stomatin/prohibitin superfamily)
MHDLQDFRAPMAHRLKLRFGRLFGVRWVGDYELAVVYRMERYDKVMGPGYFRINPFTQTVRSVINVAPDFISTTVSGIQTRDALQLGVGMALAYVFDPRSIPRDNAALFVKWPREVRRAIVTDHTQRAMQVAMPDFFAEQVCRGEVFERIERKFLNALTSRLQPLALKPLFGMVLQVKVPSALQSRFEAVVQRAVNVQDLSNYEPYELTQAMRTEALEAIQHMPGGKQYINMPDLTDMVVPTDDNQPVLRRITRPGAASDQGSQSDVSSASPRERPKSQFD